MGAVGGGDAAVVSGLTEGFGEMIFCFLGEVRFAAAVVSSAAGAGAGAASTADDGGGGGGGGDDDDDDEDDEDEGGGFDVDEDLPGCEDAGLREVG